MPTVRTVTIIGNVLPYLMVFLLGGFFPIEIFPRVIQKAVLFDPLTYFVNPLRGLWFGDIWSQHVTDVIVLSAILAAGVFISIKLFRWE